MPKPQLSPAIIEQIKGAPVQETHEAVAERLGISVPSVKKYRKAVRQEREEVAREIVARHVEDNIPDALADLTELRRLAKGAYESTGDSRDGKLWLDAIKTTLDHVKPDDSALDAEIEAELARVAEQGQGAVLGKAQGAISTGSTLY